MVLVLTSSALFLALENEQQRSWSGMQRCQLFALRLNMGLELFQILGPFSMLHGRCSYTHLQWAVIIE